MKTETNEKKLNIPEGEKNQKQKKSAMWEENELRIKTMEEHKN